MKKIIKSFLFTMAILLIICSQGGAKVFAAPNIKLEGNADGIVFIPGDGPFLSASNMLPGDKVARNIILKNRSDVPYKVFMRAERQTKEEKYDLLKKIDLSIDYEKTHVYDGPITGENGLAENICLGVVNPEETKVLEAIAQLDGQATGNEYKNKYGRVDWIFTAVKMPSTSNRRDNNNENNNNSYDNNNFYDNDGNNKNSSKQTEALGKVSSKVPYTGDGGIKGYIVVIAICLIVLLVLNKRVKEKQ